MHVYCCLEAHFRNVTEMNDLSNTNNMAHTSCKAVISFKTNDIRHNITPKSTPELCNRSRESLVQVALEHH